MSKKIYLDRNDDDAVEPYLYSKHYGKHLSAMTGENLHSKSDIAIELARRDIIIEELEAKIAELEPEVVSVDQSRVEIDEFGRTRHYDSKGNKTKSVYPDGRTFTYEYDSNGNMTKQVNPDGRTYTWDSNGNMTKKVYPDGDTYTWEYDSKGNKTKSVYPDGGTLTYEYDSNGNKTKSESFISTLEPTPPKAKG